MSHIRDLDLPTVGMELSSAEPKGSESKAVAAEGGPESGVVQKVSSARMVRSILKSDFVDMAELSEEHLVETISDGKPLPPHKLRTVPDILTWARSFRHFAGIAR